MLFGILIFLFLLLISSWILYLSIKQHNFQYTVSNINARAKELHVDWPSLTTFTGEMTTDHYESLQKIILVEGYKATVRAIIIANVSAVAAIISALCAIWAICGESLSKSF